MAIRHGVRVEARFCAVHQLRQPNGEFEPLHGHDWQVRVHLSSNELNDWGMVADFHDAQAALDEILAPLRHANLNQLPPFAHRPPTAEVVAEWLLTRLRSGRLPGVCFVEVTEAPGCVATAEWREP